MKTKSRYTLYRINHYTCCTIQYDVAENHSIHLEYHYTVIAEPVVKDIQCYLEHVGRLTKII